MIGLWCFQLILSDIEFIVTRAGPGTSYVEISFWKIFFISHHTPGAVEREDHAFIFALPVILLKFCLPWDPPVDEYNDFLRATGNEAITLNDVEACKILNSNAPMSIITFGGILKVIQASEAEMRSGAFDEDGFSSAQDKDKTNMLKLATTVVKHGIINIDLNVAVIITPHVLEVRSEDRRLSLIILSSLKEFYAYYLKNNIMSGGAVSLNN